MTGKPLELGASLKVFPNGLAHASEVWTMISPISISGHHSIYSEWKQNRVKFTLSYQCAYGFHQECKLRLPVGTYTINYPDTQTSCISPNYFTSFSMHHPNVTGQLAYGGSQDFPFSFTSWGNSSKSISFHVLLYNLEKLTNLLVTPQNAFLSWFYKPLFMWRKKAWEHGDFSQYNTMQQTQDVF